MLSSFGSDLHALVIGASGGIGRAIVDELVADPQVSQVTAYSRSGVNHNSGKVSSHRIELLDVDSIASAASNVPKAIDLLIVATGILSGGNKFPPEKSIREFDASAFATLYAVNAIGPAIIAQHFLPLMNKRTRSVFAALSARVGSIQDNRLGGWAAYRMSKSALNMMLRTAAIELSRRSPNAIVVGLHPGTVDTSLSSPFTKKLKADKLFSPTESAAMLLGVIDGLATEDTGGFFAFDGSSIEF